MSTKAKKSTKAKQSTKTKKAKTIAEEKSVLKRPTTWIMAALLFALLFIYGLSMYGFKVLEQKTKLESAELATFGHLAKMYIKDMEFDVNDQPTIKQATGYGISDEDGVLYVTFDFAPYTVEDNNIIPQGEMRHAIIYFQKDTERGTYGHAFGYYDDASYHPEGTYVKFTDFIGF